MARIICTLSLIVILNVLAGCNEANTGKGQMIAPIAKGAMAPGLAAADAEEIDLVEEMAANRKAYRQSLEMLMQHYESVGNHMKLQWAQQELQAFDEMPQYKYVIEAAVASSDLRAGASIPQADALYDEAVQLHEEADKLLVLKDKDLLRLALDRYNRVFREYPTSDKIDDAAFKAGTIYEHFKDYAIASTYYERAYQWDPATPHPARFRRAYILDNKLQRRAEALELYREALEIEAGQDRYQTWQTYAERRVGELSKTVEPVTNP